MLDLRAEMRQSSGDVKPRNVRGVAKKPQHLGAPIAANIAKLPGCYAEFFC